MNTLFNLWNWFNGKKTIIGVFLIALATFISNQIVPLINIEPEPAWIITLVSTLQWLGATIGTIGVGHKISKPGEPATK